MLLIYHVEADQGCVEFCVDFGRVGGRKEVEVLVFSQHLFETVEGFEDYASVLLLKLLCRGEAGLILGSSIQGLPRFKPAHLQHHNFFYFFHYIALTIDY